MNHMHIYVSSVLRRFLIVEHIVYMYTYMIYCLFVVTKNLILGYLSLVGEQVPPEI